MSKEIFLYSGDNKYQAYVELADSTDRFGCPDHSFFKLIENRNDDKLYLIAEARDGLLETEKDQRIAELKQDLEFTTKTANDLIEIKHKLEKQLEEKDKEINIKNNKLAELKKELTICKDKLRRKTQSNRDLQHRVHNINTQLAIQKLEEVKMLIEWKFNSIVEVREYLQQQIKELKGEHDE